MHTTKPLVPSFGEVEIVTENLEGYTSPGNNQIPSRI
jgi:hypothetical protein